MSLISGLHPQTEEAGIDIHVDVGALVADRYDIGSGGCDQRGNIDQLTGFVGQSDGHVGGTTLFDKTAGDNTGKDVYVDVAAGDHAADFFAFDVDLVEHGSSNRNRTGTFGDHLMLFDQSEDRSGDLVIGDSDDLIDISAADIIGQVTGVFDRDTVSKGGNAVESAARLL